MAAGEVGDVMRKLRASRGAILLAMLLGGCAGERLDLDLAGRTSDAGDAAQPPGDGGPSLDQGGAPACAVEIEADGWPFDLAAYQLLVYPLLVNACAECHGAPRPAGQLSVAAGAMPRDCAWQETFVSFAALVDLAEPAASTVYRRVAGDPTHPFALDAQRLQVLRGFLEDAANTARTEPPPNPEPDPEPEPEPDPGPGPRLDLAGFQSVVHPIIVRTGCTGCHAAESPTSGLGFHRDAAPGSPEMVADHQAVVARCSPDQPAQSLFYRYATSNHGGNDAVTPPDAALILAWISGE